jgi:hypothetical protein
MEKIIHKQDVVEYQSVFTKEECSNFISYWNSLDDWMLSCFPGMYTISGKKPNEGAGKELVFQAKDKMHKLAEEVFSKKLKPLTLSTHKWTPGAWAADHADNAELDGTPNAWKENKLVAIVYLNDDYEGGKLTFRDHKIGIKPTTGNVIVFGVGIDNVHAVTEILGGDRYTMMCSFDFEDSVYDEDLQAQKESVYGAQEDLRKQWAEGILMPKTTATDPTI